MGWVVGLSGRARRQRRGFNRIVRELLAVRLAALAEEPLGPGGVGLDNGDRVVGFGWYGSVVYSVDERRRWVLVHDCRWNPPLEASDRVKCGVAPTGD